MNTADRNAYIEKFLDEHIRPVLMSKGVEYSQGQEDANSNFKRHAESLGMEPEQVLFVYLGKHMDSITYAIKTGNFFDLSEPIEGRVGDAINYLLILASLIEERRNAESDNRERPDGNSDLESGRAKGSAHHKVAFPATR